MILQGSDPQGVIGEQIQGAKVGEVVWKRAALSKQLLAIDEK